jgi:1-phosphofructokinase family hexose kinase
MIITLTPNTGIDHTIQVSSLGLNRTIRALDSAWGMGGKAIDTSWILGKLGVPSRALGFAAGSNGMRMETMLRERGVETDFTWVEGESRLNTVLVVPGEGQSTITSSSLYISYQHLDAFRVQYQAALQDAACVVMGGSLPNGVPVEFYAEAITQAHDFNVPVIFDSSGPALAAGLKSRPEVVKPNYAELQDVLGYMPQSQTEVKQAAEKLCAEFGTNVIVTLGEDGAITVFGDASYFVHPISVPVLSVAGAGDGVLAGLALAYERQQPLEYGLHHGFALAAAVLQTLPTADFRLEDYHELLPRIQITPLE